MTPPASATLPLDMPASAAGQSDVRGSVAVDLGAPRWQQMRRFAGPGLLVAIGYMDPGNWATDIESGSRLGYALLWVVVASSLGAMVLQLLAARLGLVTGKDLARHSRERYGPRVWPLQWLGAQVSIVACDLAEVLGGALAFKLLLGVPLLWGVALTAVMTVLVLGLHGRGVRQLEAVIIALLVCIMGSFAVQLVLTPPDWAAVALGLVPTLPSLPVAGSAAGSTVGNTAGSHHAALVLALGIVGATIMPHNLYLHSSLVQTRHAAPTGAPLDLAQRQQQLRKLLGLARWDTLISLAMAMAVNAAILILAAAAFHAPGQVVVSDLAQAYERLLPIAGGAAALLFGLALLASGQSSTLTGTLAAQIILDGFLRLRWPAWVTRLLTRALALVPAALGVYWLGDAAVGDLLVWSQVVLSLQLPMAMWPLIRLCSERRTLGEFTISRFKQALAWGIFALICSANAVLVVGLFRG
ncbi:Nramp family divalent metal transporter [Amphibiibacter pelophylacis]|uniref:Nramp family divalent metal transporter n=1 Tax=Amphibiibacter pelophylacis TaxID=1799477 RepID=A0ACC6P185_9BURK